MKFIFSTGSLYTYGIDRCFDLAAGAGFDGIELMVDQRWDTRQPAYLQRLIDHFSLPIVAVHSPFFGVPGWPSDHPSLIQKSVKLAETVGASVVVHHLPERIGYLLVLGADRRILLPIPGWDRQRSYREWLLNDYANFQTQTAITLCIENMPAKWLFGQRLNPCTWNSVEEIVRFPALTLDTTHLATWGLEPLAVYGRWQDQVRHVHLSNFDGKEHRRPETGRLQLDRLLAQMAADGYNGAISLELHPDAVDAGQEDAHLLALLTTSLAYCRQSAGQHPPQRQPTLTPTLEPA